MDTHVSHRPIPSVGIHMLDTLRIQLITGIKKAGPRGGTHRFLGFRRRRRGPHAPFLRVAGGDRDPSDDVGRLLCLSSCAGATLGAARAAPTARRLPDRARTRVALVAHFIRKSKCVVRCLEAIFSSDRCAIAVCRSCRFLGWAHWVVGGTHRFLTPNAQNGRQIS